MKDNLIILALTFIIIVFFYNPAYASFGVSLDLNNSQTDNLMNDASEIDSPIRSASLGLKYYPISQLELSGSLQHTRYDKIYDTTIEHIGPRTDTIESITNISNSLYGFGATWIPTKSGNKTSIFIKTSFDRVIYEGDTRAFDNSILTFSASIGYQIKPAIHLRAGSKFTSNYYLNKDSIDGDNAQFELFSGANFSLPGSNSLDIEGGFGSSTYQFIDDIKYPTYPPDPYLAGDIHPSKLVEKGSFQNLYISPRISRPIGNKTGISLTYTYKHFINVDNSVVLGYSTSFLSPWSSFYGGSSVVFKVKTYLIPKVIITAGAGYWDKKYLRTIGLVNKEMFPGYFQLVYSQPGETPVRKEWQSRFYVDAKRPITFSGLVIEPSVSVDYKINRSTSEAYDYSTTTFSFGLSLRDNF